MAFPEKFPEPNLLGGRCVEAKMAFDKTAVGRWSPEACWAALQPSLRILNKTVPEADQWVRDKHDKGQIQWEDKNGPTYARYDYIDGTLTITSGLFCEMDGIRATKLAHEFRHSRQNSSKVVRMAIACAFTGKSNDFIVENDAYLYEHDVFMAIFQD